MKASDMESPVWPGPGHFVVGPVLTRRGTIDTARALGLNQWPHWFRTLQHALRGGVPDRSAAGRRFITNHSWPPWTLDVPETLVATRLNDRSIRQCPGFVAERVRRNSSFGRRQLRISFCCRRNAVKRPKNQAFSGIRAVRQLAPLRNSSLTPRKRQGLHGQVHNWLVGRWRARCTLREPAFCMSSIALPRLVTGRMDPLAGLRLPRASIKACSFLPGYLQRVMPRAPPYRDVVRADLRDVEHTTAPGSKTPVCCALRTVTRCRP